MSIEMIIKYERECKLVKMISANLDNISNLSPQGIFSSRIRIGKQINELGKLLQIRIKETTTIPSIADMGIFTWLCYEYSIEVKNCRNYLITDEDDKVYKLRRWAEEYIIDYILRHVKSFSVARMTGS